MSNRAVCLTPLAAGRRRRQGNSQEDCPRLSSAFSFSFSLTLAPLSFTLSFNFTFAPEAPSLSLSRSRARSLLLGSVVALGVLLVHGVGYE